jgi:hypothetical protein
MASSFAPQASMVMDIQDSSQRALPPRENEDREIVDVVMRLRDAKDFNVTETCALFHVLQVDPKFWPDMFAKTFIDAFQQAEEYGNRHKWEWSDEERKKIADGGLQENFLLKRADSIAWAQAFVVRQTPHNLAGYRKDNNGKYPKFQPWFANFIVKMREGFIENNKPEPIRPSEEKSDGKGSGGSGGTGGVGFLIGAVVIALLAFAILMYFLLR